MMSTSFSALKRLISAWTTLYESMYFLSKKFFWQLKTLSKKSSSIICSLFLIMENNPSQSRMCITQGVKEIGWDGFFIVFYESISKSGSEIVQNSAKFYSILVPANGHKKKKRKQYCPLSLRIAPFLPLLTSFCMENAYKVIKRCVKRRCRNLTSSKKTKKRKDSMEK